MRWWLSEGVRGREGRSRSGGNCCGRGPWWWWWFWTLPENRKGGIWRLGTGYGVGGGWWQAQWLGAVVVVVIGVLMGVVMGSEGDGVPGKQSPAGARRVTESKPE